MISGDGVACFLLPWFLAPLNNLSQAPGTIAASDDCSQHVFPTMIDYPQTMSQNEFFFPWALRKVMNRRFHQYECWAHTLWDSRGKNEMGWQGAGWTAQLSSQNELFRVLLWAVDSSGPPGMNRGWRCWSPVRDAFPYRGRWGRQVWKTNCQSKEAGNADGHACLKESPVHKWKPVWGLSVMTMTKQIFYIIIYFNLFILHSCHDLFENVKNMI